MDYDVLIIGAGPGGIFTAWELTEKAERPLKVAVLELGKPLEKRKCAGRPLDRCAASRYTVRVQPNKAMRQKNSHGGPEASRGGCKPGGRISVSPLPSYPPESPKGQLWRVGDPRYRIRGG